MDFDRRSGGHPLRCWDSVRQHDELIRLCGAGHADGAAAVAYDTWHSLPSAEG